MKVHAGRFRTVDRVLITPEEKRAVRQATGEDAAEMESGVIREVCTAHGVPCLVLRVISDAADNDAEAVNRLIRTNWLRTAGWSLVWLLDWLG